jgi:hypothetical protein
MLPKRKAKVSNGADPLNGPKDEIDGATDTSFPMVGVPLGRLLVMVVLTRFHPSDVAFSKLLFLM